MKVHEYLVLITFTVSVVSVENGVATKGAGLLDLYMEDHCRTHFYQYLLDNDRVYIDRSIVLLLANKPQGDTKMTCVATFAARDSRHRLLLHFESVDINYHMGTTDRLHIYDGFDAQTELTPHSGLYGKYAKGVYEFSSGSIHDYLSQGQALSLYFIGTPSPRFSGFKAILTVFKDVHTNGSCDDGYFHCAVNGHCISQDLVCNGHQNCGDGDGSDEEHCGTDPVVLDQYDMQDLGVLIGCGIAIVILLVVVLWMGILCIKKASLRRRQYREWLSACRQRPEAPEPGRIFWPRWAYMDPPPLYSEHPQDSSQPTIQPFELPPPYSMEEHDQANLIVNEAPVIALLTGPQAENRPNAGTRRSHAGPQRGRHPRRVARGVRPSDPNTHPNRHSSGRRQRHHSGCRENLNTPVMNNMKNETQESQNTSNSVNITVVEVGIASQRYQAVRPSPSSEVPAPIHGSRETTPPSPPLPTSNTSVTNEDIQTEETLHMDPVKSSDSIPDAKPDSELFETCGESTA